MPHTTEITGYRRISSGEFAIDICCCGEHQHPHTVGSVVMGNKALLEASILGAHRQAAADHDAAVKMDEHLKSLVGSKVEHPSSDSSGYENVLERALQNQQSK